MLVQFRKWISETFTPFTVIARELTTLRELYELDLGSRQPPIYRVTEEPGKSDTQVSYMDEPIKVKTPLQRMMEGLTGETDDDDLDEDDYPELPFAGDAD